MFPLKSLLFLFLVLNFGLLAADGDAPEILKIEASNPVTGEQITVEVVTAATAEKLDSAANWLQGTIETAAKEGALVHVTTFSTASTAQTQGGTSALVREVTEGVPHVVVENVVVEAEEPALVAAQEKYRSRMNAILTAVRFVGVGTGVTLAVSLATNVPLLDAFLGPGISAGAMSASLQWFNKPFQRWLTSSRFFNTTDLDQAPHRVTFVKLIGVTAIYLGVMKTALVLKGIEPSPLLDPKGAAFDYGVSTLMGTTLEYFWDRYISQTLKQSSKEDPKNEARHQLRADIQAALISIAGTAAQTLAVAGFGVGHIAGGFITATGVGNYMRRFVIPREIYLKWRARWGSSLKSCAKAIRNLFP